jgi:cyclophilin family peptidyl-prolyl cis-trans isomerase
MKKLVFAFLLLLSLPSMAQTDTIKHEVLLNTSMGDIRIKLYNETPKHRDNFLKLVKSGFYDGVLFHRVIDRFMIQTGDSATRHAKPGELLGATPEAYKIPAEIRFPAIFHKRGVVAAAREGDDINPERESSMCQFYIVYGKRYNDDLLDVVEDKLDTRTHGQVKLTPEIREVYKSVGGTPNLDGQYTVFGEVVQGMDVVDQIQRVECDANDRPLTDVKIIKATIVK